MGYISTRAGLFLDLFSVIIIIKTFAVDSQESILNTL